MIYDRAFDVVIDDAFLRLPGFIAGAEVLLKLEGLNPAGSIKIKTAVALVEGAELNGRLRPGQSVIESSSGNLGIALCQVCSAKGYPVTVVTDPNTNPACVRAMAALGANVIVVTDRDANGGFLGRRVEYIQRALRRDPQLVWLNQYANPANAAAHRDRTARYIHRELGSVDVLVVGVSTTGTLMGCLAYFREHSPSTRIVAVDTAGSVIFGQPPAPRHIPGIGASRRPELFVDAPDLDKVIVPEARTIAMCRRIAREYGLLIGGSSGTVLAGLDLIAATVPAGARVVAISPDFGDRYLHTIYDDEWAAAHYPQAPTAP
jgi:N-(2-amino-2-carboxyethyl)-L-glutamate synthase